MGTPPMDAAMLSQYLQYPIQTPPPGIIPNFLNSDSNAYQVYATAGACIPLMLMFATLRWVCKKFYQEAKVVDELVFVAGLIFSIVFIAMTIICVSGGAFGHHAWDVLLGAFTKRQLVMALLVEIILPVAICLVKVSVLILYLHVFWVIDWLRIASIISIALIVVYHLGLSITFATMCAPSTGSGQLDFLAAFISARCTRTRVLVLLQGVGNVVTDLWLMVMPLPGIWVLNMPFKKKLAVSSMFLVGVIALCSSITGLVYRVQYYTVDEDNIRLVVPLWVTSIIEEAAGIIICCMPMTATVFKRVKQPLFNWLSSVNFRTLHVTKISSQTNESKRSEEQFKSSEFLAGYESNVHFQLQELNTQIPSHAVYDPIFPQESHKTWVNTHEEVDQSQLLLPNMNSIQRKTGYQVSRDGLVV